MSALGAEVRIKNKVIDFIQFSNSVDKRTSYLGTTVFLDSDIDLTAKAFEPIGGYSNYFSGTFDGQGHVISNLKMITSSQFVGLFGFSLGFSIKNVILDPSCFTTSSFSGSNNAYAGRNYWRMLCKI